MKSEEILKIMKYLEDSKLTYFLHEEDGNILELRKEVGSRIEYPLERSFEREENTSLPREVIKNIKEDQEPEENFKYVTSPIVGTFYGSPNPNSPQFVKVGDKINKGKVLCIIEAMKLMNEIEAELEGEIVEVLVKNEDLVEFGQKLFKVR